ncbi:MAG: hypothetical protein ACXWM7_07310 [Parachlamydiaceae bacterium]
MPKQIPQNELDAILKIESTFPEGASFGKIVEALNCPISPRNIHHRLHFLVKKGYLQILAQADVCERSLLELQNQSIIP